MSAVLVAMFADHDSAAQVRTRLVQDGFPTDRVQLTSNQDLGQAKLVPATSSREKLLQHFQQLVQGSGELQAAEHLCDLVLGGQAVLTVQPRGEIETQRATQLLTLARPEEMRGWDLENQQWERAAAPDDRPLIRSAETVLKGPGEARGDT